METYRIKSKFLSVINEAITKISIMEDDASFTEPSMDSEGNFYTDITSSNEPKVSSGEVSKVDDFDDDKEELVRQATEKLKQSLDISAELDDIINKIKKVDSQVSNKWELNKDHSDLYLQSKNAHIFKQNDNLMLSHNGVIENFKSVADLKTWLSANDYPEVPPVTIYESRK